MLKFFGLCLVSMVVGAVYFFLLPIPSIIAGVLGAYTVGLVVSVIMYYRKGSLSPKPSSSSSSK